jgi:hypothetical protein
VETNKIKFVTNRPWLNAESTSTPSPANKEIPEWYRRADRYIKNPMTGDYYTDPTGGKAVNWKACPAIFDTMTSGYVLKTPCNINFFINDRETIDVRVDDEKYKDFCTPREPMTQFYQPDGYYLNHFAWFIDWGVVTPPGYSVLYTNPMNRFDLPFLNTTGIIDNDKVHLSGSLPFFLIQNWTGTIPAGTAYAQLFPFKRENWESEIVVEDPRKIPSKNHLNSKKYRVKDGGVYQKNVWERRSYT